jgi:hypothetical protein
MNILIVTLKDDLHAVAIKHEIEKRSSASCSILEIDRISEDVSIFWCEGNKSECLVKSSETEVINISEIDLIWWRRSRSDQILDKKYSSEAITDLINQDCRATSLGILMSSFKGKWISHPTATLDSSNKLIQLKAARKVREFIRETAKVIVKPVSGTKHALLFTQMVDPSLLEDESISACPAIYQEYIEGTKHLRINTFGDSSYGAEISTTELDWRCNMKTQYTPYQVDSDLHTKIRSVLDELHLEMGIVDIKIDEQGLPVWLEVNPQGQFLFVEGMTKEPLRTIFADYLVSEAANAVKKQKHKATASCTGA